jgi:hypothetical protein
VTLGPWQGIVTRRQGSAPGQLPRGS